MLKALLFDVFGTCVDWRTSVAGQAAALGLPGEAVADAWRARYQPQLERVRSGERAWVVLDVLHREALDDVLAELALDLPPGQRDELTLAWHRLDPWPDTVPGLARLKERFVITTLSNGNMSLLTNMAKRAGLPWDCVISAELFHHYKPDPQAYLGCADLLGVAPDQLMLVAAHPSDLRAAREAGLRTAFVFRPAEHGPDRTLRKPPQDEFDFLADDFLDLADQLGA